MNFTLQNAADISVSVAKGMGYTAKFLALPVAVGTISYFAGLDVGETLGGINYQAGPITEPCWMQSPSIGAPTTYCTFEDSKDMVKTEFSQFAAIMGFLGTAFYNSLNNVIKNNIKKKINANIDSLEMQIEQSGLVTQGT